MRVQVLSIGETQSGKTQRGDEWHRRTFQVYCPDGQVAGNIPVYGKLEDLNSYKQGGLYEAETTARAGQGGRIEISINKLTPVKQA